LRKHYEENDSSAQLNILSGDVDFMCKIHQMLMWICRTIRISTSYYSHCDST